MTPQQLRRKAWEFLRGADALLASGNHEMASYNAGYVVELALKARYCTRRGLADFPTDRKAAKKLGIPEVITHDLDELLTLSDTAKVRQNSFYNIDWNRASDWSVEQRYAASGSVSREQAAMQLGETRKLFVELALYELTEQLAKLERALADQMGPFVLFVLGDRIAHQRGWELVLAAEWLRVDTTTKLDEIIERVRAAVDEDLVELIATFVVLKPEDRRTRAFNMLISCEHSMAFAQDNIVNGWRMPNSFIITSRRRAA